ncbi:hypothetical protein [Nostoc sp. DedQUE02]|uniref:hypothetical protein n=1 Tax=Nostoc sp. DedQUE02 TaxID=3075388 RepID=UPI002AD4C387|nr:hypothetical protein [Nostoc sp. DedQUE03]MDZ8047166.1 hypothetical protein [Nostoc sp. DedQUE02]
MLHNLFFEVGNNNPHKTYATGIGDRNHCTDRLIVGIDIRRAIQLLNAIRSLLQTGTLLIATYLPLTSI